MEAVLITGSTGQLGKCLTEVLMGKYRVAALSRSDFDLTDPSRIEEHLDEKSFKAVINCAAYTSVDQAEEEPDLAEQINATAVGVIAQACAGRNIPLIHLSTDYVYDNGIERPLKETDPVAPRSVYARTKLRGEQSALAACEQSFILRTSWVFSEYGKNFVLTMLRLAEKGIDPRVVSDQRGSPTYARDLAEAIDAVIANIEHSAPGIYNFCNAGETTWFDFAKEIFELSGTSATVHPISTAEFGAPAERPSYSVLDTSRFQREFGIEPRNWRAALRDCIARLSDRASGDN